VRSVERNSIATQDESLWRVLRETRLKIAREQGVPPYVIFHDATLQAMIKERPQSLREFGTISGVGERKLEKYGAAFLGVLMAHS
jgi:ATP-dependent DNA helicase RecQ